MYVTRAIFFVPFFFPFLSDVCMSFFFSHLSLYPGLLACACHAVPVVSMIVPSWHTPLHCLLPPSTALRCVLLMDWWYICVVQQCVHSGFVHGHGVCTYAVSYIGVRWSCPPGRVPRQRRWQRQWQAWSYDAAVTTSITPTLRFRAHDTIFMMWYHKNYQVWYE